MNQLEKTLSYHENRTVLLHTSCWEFKP